MSYFSSADEREEFCLCSSLLCLLMRREFFFYPAYALFLLTC